MTIPAADLPLLPVTPCAAAGDQAPAGTGHDALATRRPDNPVPAGTHLAVPHRRLAGIGAFVKLAPPVLARGRVVAPPAPPAPPAVVPAEAQEKTS